MPEIYDGGSAFPAPDVFGPKGELLYEGSVGMSIREWYASKALVGLLSGGFSSMPPQTVSDMAFRFADAMISRSLEEAIDLHLNAPGSESVKILSEVAKERNRQIEVEGFTRDHDDGHVDGEIARSAACYAWVSQLSDVARELQDWSSLVVFKRLWPWNLDFFKPKNRRHDLVRAAALIIAEIERLDRAAAKAKE